MKSWLKNIAYRALSLFGPAFADRRLHVRRLLRHVFVQKVLRVNAHVPWPVHWTSEIRAVGRIQRGTRFPGLSIGCYLDGRNGIVIGQNVWIGPRVSLISMNHCLDDFERWAEADPIVIGDNCWLGANAVILPGVRLGDHVVVAAGAVVTHSFPEDDVLLAGVPARIVKRLGPYQGAR